VGIDRVAVKDTARLKMRKPMHDRPGTRWDAFTAWELQALDEFFRSFGPMRNYHADIGKLGGEIAAAVERRGITPLGPVEPKPKRSAPPDPAP
jgi:hypothetical protein